MSIVIHINAFTCKISGGYLMNQGIKVGSFMMPAEIVAKLAENIDAHVFFQHV